MSEIMFINGRFVTLDPARPRAEAVLVRNGRFASVGSTEEVMRQAGRNAEVVEMDGRLAVPGLHDSALRFARGGLTFTVELRWDGVSSLEEALSMLRTQAEHTPPPQWVRIAGGFSLHQFREKRLPTLDELNAAAPETPVLVLHLNDRVLLNASALRVIGFDRNTIDPLGCEVRRDARGNPTGLVIAEKSANILHYILTKGPRLTPDDQEISTRLFMRELNRLGVTSVIDCGGGYEKYPEDYRIVEKLAREGGLTVRVAYNVAARTPGAELEDFKHLTDAIPLFCGSERYRHNGAGGTLAFSADDFGNFRQARPCVPAGMKKELEGVVRLLVHKRWPFRLQAAYDKTIGEALEVFEKVNREIPFEGLHWFFDQAETISPANIDRVRALNGGIAVQPRMAYQGEFFASHYGEKMAAEAPPIRRILAAGVPVGAGSGGTREASYNPWVCLYWMVTGKTLGGEAFHGHRQVLGREEALRLYTDGSAWMANRSGGRIAEGEFGDLAVPSADYFEIPEDHIRFLQSDLTVVGGDVVYADGAFADMAPAAITVTPKWSPVARFGGYHIDREIAESFHESLYGCGCGCGGW